MSGKCTSLHNLPSLPPLSSLHSIACLLLSHSIVHSPRSRLPFSRIDPPLRSLSLVPTCSPLPPLLPSCMYLLSPLVKQLIFFRTFFFSVFPTSLLPCADSLPLFNRIHNLRWGMGISIPHPRSCEVHVRASAGRIAPQWIARGVR